jgi:hypothetical protein
MDIVTIDDLKPLMEPQDGWCISLFMPTHRGGPDVQQDPIRLRNLLRDAEDQLLAQELRQPDVDALLAPARRLLDEPGFWHEQSDGLAVFVGASSFHHFSVPLDLSELVIVGEAFYLKPLLPLLTGDGRFYVLALSQNAVRLLQGTRHSVELIDLPGVPLSM